MIEDDYLDVLGKAMRGHGLGDVEVMEAAGVDAAAWKAFRSGEFCGSVARACARVLGLGEDAYATHPAFHPAPLRMAGIQRLELPFGSYGVNAWWLELDGTAVLFDSGCSTEELAAALPRMPEMACITHGHHDHIGGVGHLTGCGVPVHAASGVAVALVVRPGRSLSCGRMRFEVLDVSGHFSPAVAYLVSGFDRPVMVIGDALFAGSMGKCATPADYQVALRWLHAAFAGQPDELVILPGHGPATTLGEELKSNPFLAGGSAVEERA